MWRQNILLIFVCLSGCASSTGVMSMGPDTYTVTAQSEFGPGYAQKKALEDANVFAASKSKHIIPKNVQTRVNYDAFGGRIHIYELIFWLVDSDDPEYQRTNLEKTPDIVAKSKLEIDANVNIGETSKRSDLYTKLMKLKALKDEGILTEEEFQQEKKKLLKNGN